MDRQTKAIVQTLTGRLMEEAQDALMGTGQPGPFNAAVAGLVGHTVQVRDKAVAVSTIHGAWMLASELVDQFQGEDGSPCEAHLQTLGYLQFTNKV